MHLLNYKEVSRLLTGSKENIRRDKTPNKYKDKVSELVLFCEQWEKKHKI